MSISVKISRYCQSSPKSIKYCCQSPARSLQTQGQIQTEVVGWEAWRLVGMGRPRQPKVRWQQGEGSGRCCSNSLQPPTLHGWGPEWKPNNNQNNSPLSTDITIDTNTVVHQCHTIVYHGPNCWTFTGFEYQIINTFHSCPSEM